MRLGALALLAAVAGCGKELVHEQTEKAWEPATPANGFQPVRSAACTKVDAAGKIANTLNGSIEDVRLSTTTDLATDDQYIYWVENRTLFRTARASSPWPHAWVGEILLQNVPETELAVTKDHIYWSSDGLHAFDKKTHDVTTVATAPGQPGNTKLVARGASLFWSTNDGITEVEDDGHSWRLERVVDSASNPVFAVDDRNVYAYSRSGFFTVHRRRPWATPSGALVAATDPLDAISDGTFLYWIERGPSTPADEDCEKCSTGYRMVGQPQHAEGKLRRAPVAGGAPTDLYVGLPNVESLTMVKGILWISTRQGLLRYDPTCHLPPARVAPTAGVYGRAAPFGEALAVLAQNPAPHVALVASP